VPLKPTFLNPPLTYLPSQVFGFFCQNSSKIGICGVSDKIQRHRKNIYFKITDTGSCMNKSPSSGRMTGRGYWLAERELVTGARGCRGGCRRAKASDYLLVRAVMPARIRPIVSAGLPETWQSGRLLTANGDRSKAQWKP
jgi:hypothetical protein